MPPRLMGGYDPCLDDYARIFYNRADVQKSLHASDGVNLKNWSICKYSSQYYLCVILYSFCVYIYIYKNLSEYSLVF